MLRILELILGLRKGFLSGEGHFVIQFNPSWPWQQYVGGAAVWNFLLGGLALALVIYVYRRDARSNRVRIGLGAIRLVLLAFVLTLLNRPVLTLGQIHREPSILAVLIDDSLSMKVKDMSAPDGKPVSRLDAVVNLLDGKDADLLRRLAATHTVRLYDFSRGQREIASVPEATDATLAHASDLLGQLKPDGDGTQLVSSLRSLLQDLQGQRVAGVVVFSDGRETPTESPLDAYTAVKAFGINLYPVPVGTDKMARNVAVDSVTYEPSAFVNDITFFKVSLHATGYEPNHPITLTLQRQVTQDGKPVLEPVRDEHGQEISRTVAAPDDKPFDADLQFKPSKNDMPTANLVIAATPQPDELDDADNYRPVQLDVLDDNISVLFVDGYPRWDYRYLKTSLLRDRTIKVSCLLTSADPSFHQDGSDDPTHPHGTWAINSFPTSMEQLLDYDVVLLGDVDPREFTDAQLQLINDYVSKKGGGFEMVAGPRWSPQSYRNTPIESLLPVIIAQTQADDGHTSITTGFRPVVTKAGAESSIFRFLPDVASNDEFLKNQIQELFWYCRGLMVKPGVGIVYAEHPVDLGPDGHKAPILVAGRFGAGRTIFSAIDDSWRWRFYTGETTFNTYWIQQLRYLAHGRKLGQRKLTFSSEQAFELGKQVTLQLRLLSPELLQQLSPPVSVQIVDDATGQPLRRVELNRQEGATDIFTGSYTADKVGNFTAKLPTIGDQEKTVSYTIRSPQLELNDPRVDIAALSRLATDAPIPFSDAAEKLLAIRSAAKIIPVETSEPLWNAPLALVIFAILITVEWISRKMFGML